MKTSIFIAAFALCGTLAFAKDAKPYQTGTLLQMNSVECGSEQKSATSMAGEIIGTDANHSKSHVLLCQEYVLESDKVTYHIRPKEEKHPSLLPVNAKAQFRIQKDKMKLLVEDLDGKEHDYIVVSMSPREDAPTGGSR